MSATPPGHILLVEDEPAVRLLLLREFQERGHDVIAVETAEQALTILAERSIDVVLTDIRMPGIGGVALCRMVRRDWPHTDVVLMTGFASLETAAECLRLGAFDYLLKPFSELEVVMSCIERALEKQRLTAEADMMRSRLAHSDRLVTIGRLAAGVAHEINNPSAFVLANLTVMQETVSALRLSTPPSAITQLDDLEEMIADNQYGLHRITSIVRDLRNFSRIESDEIEWVDLNEVAHLASSMVLHQVRIRAHLVTELDQLPVIAGDKGKLVQVVVNLLVNAVHAIPEGDSTGHRITVRTRLEGDRVTLEVQDTGCGIAPADVEVLFEPFNTTKGPGQGTGLGLTLAREIATHHGGGVTVKSNLGEGSTFTMNLPLETGLAVPEPRTPTTPQITEERRRVLLIDDEKSLLRACQRMLSSHFDVVPCSYAEEALALLQEDRAFDAVVCDLMMPGMDGEQFYHQVCMNHPELVSRILIMTGGSPRPRSQEFAQQLSHCLEKPFTLEDFRAAIEELLRGVE